MSTQPIQNQPAAPETNNSGLLRAAKKIREARSRYEHGSDGGTSGRSDQND